MGFQDYYNKEQAGIDEGKQQADTKTTGVKSPGQQDVLFFLDPPKWAREGATKFTNWLKKTSLKGNEMEKSLSKMMITANIKSKDAVTELDKDLDRQVKVIKKVRGVSGMEYNSEKTRLGWTDKEPTIWLLLTFEGKMKTPKGVHPVEVSTCAHAYLKIDPDVWNKSREIRFSEIKILLDEVSFSDQTGIR